MNTATRNPRVNRPTEKPEHLYRTGNVCVGLPQSAREFIANGSGCRDPRAAIRRIAVDIIPGMLSTEELLVYILERSAAEAGLSTEEVRRIVDQVEHEWVNFGVEPPAKPKPKRGQSAELQALEDELWGDDEEGGDDE